MCCILQYMNLQGKIVDIPSLTCALSARAVLAQLVHRCLSSTATGSIQTVLPGHSSILDGNGFALVVTSGNGGVSHGARTKIAQVTFWHFDILWPSYMFCSHKQWMTVLLLSNVVSRACRTHVLPIKNLRAISRVHSASIYVCCLVRLRAW